MIAQVPIVSQKYYKNQLQKILFLSNLLIIFFNTDEAISEGTRQDTTSFTAA